METSEPLKSRTKVGAKTVTKCGKEPSLSGVLKEELQIRIRRNPTYSLRAFARDLGFSASSICEVMNGKYGLSRQSIRKIGIALNYSEWQVNHLVDLVDAQYAQDPDRRRIAKQRLRRQKLNPEPYEFKADDFEKVADWHHLALLCLIEIEGFDSNSAWIGDRLSLKPRVVLEAVNRLERLGLLELDECGRIKGAQPWSRVADGVAPAAMKKFHCQILEKAAMALRVQTREERSYGCILLPLAKEALPEVNAAALEFRRKVEEISKKYAVHHEVYAVASQVYRVSEPAAE